MIGYHPLNHHPTKHRHSPSLHINPLGNPSQQGGERAWFLALRPMWFTSIWISSQLLTLSTTTNSASNNSILVLYWSVVHGLLQIHTSSWGHEIHGAWLMEMVSDLGWVALLDECSIFLGNGRRNDKKKLSELNYGPYIFSLHETMCIFIWTWGTWVESSPLDMC